MKTKITGIFAPITTPFTNEDVSIYYLRENMQKYRETHLAGFFTLGSNGEYKSLSENEKIKILEVVLKEKADHQLVMAGTGYESTRLTIEFSKKVASLGVNFVSVLTPFYFKNRLSDEALIRFYMDVADSLTIPMFVYNAPSFTGVTISAKVVEKISRHPNIVGMKDTSVGNTSDYLEACGNHWVVLSGTIKTLFAALMLGASGGVVSLANVLPELCCDLFDKCQSGDLPAARKLHYRLFKINRLVSGSFGVAGVKYAMDLAGYYGGDPRLPLLPLKEADKKLIRDALSIAEIL